MAEKKLSLAVHLHMHYLEMWPEIRKYLTNIGNYPYDLFVTMTRENAELEQEIKAFKPEANIWVVENRGYDVGPFIEFLHRIDLNKYDLVMKLHTKNKNNGTDTYIGHYVFDRPIWAKCLLSSLLGSRRIFQKNIKAFEQSRKLGMIGSKYLIASKLYNDDDMESAATNIVKKLGYKDAENKKFVAGTMFMVRSPLLQRIKDNFKITDFDITDSSIKNGTPAHMMERVFGYVVTAQGYKIKGFDRNYTLIWRKIWHFLWQNKITKNNYRLIKVCKIPLLHRKVSQA